MAVSGLFIPTFMYVLYPLIMSKSLWVATCNRVMSLSCLWRNSAPAFSSSLTRHWPLESLLSVCHYSRNSIHGKRRFSYTSFNTSLSLLLLFLRVRDPLVSNFSFYGAWGLSVVMRSRTPRKNGMACCHPHTYLYLACPNSLILHIRLGELMCFLLLWYLYRNITASLFPLLPPRCSQLGPPPL